MGFVQSYLNSKSLVVLCDNNKYCGGRQRILLEVYVHSSL